MAELRKAPKGKVRIIQDVLHSPFNNSLKFVQDCSTHEEAFRIVDERNAGRTSHRSDVFYVCDDQGNLLLEDQVSGFNSYWP